MRKVIPCTVGVSPTKWMPGIRSMRTSSVGPRLGPTMPAAARQGHGLLLCALQALTHLLGTPSVAALLNDRIPQSVLVSAVVVLCPLIKQEALYL